MERSNLSLIASGTWSCRIGTAGGDRAFGNSQAEENQKFVFDNAMVCRLNLWSMAGYVQVEARGLWKMPLAMLRRMI